MESTAQDLCQFQPSMRVLRQVLAGTDTQQKDLALGSAGTFTRLMRIPGAIQRQGVAEHCASAGGYFAPSSSSGGAGQTVRL